MDNQICSTHILRSQSGPYESFGRDDTDVPQNRRPDPIDYSQDLEPEIVSRPATQKTQQQLGSRADCDIQ